MSEAAAKVIAGMENGPEGGLLETLRPMTQLEQRIYGRLAENGNNHSAAAKEIIPLIQADLIRRMVEPSKEMLRNGAVRLVSGERGVIVRESWQAMLRTFAEQNGVKL